MLIVVDGCSTSCLFMVEQGVYVVSEASWLLKSSEVKYSKQTKSAYTLFIFYTLYTLQTVVALPSDISILQLHEKSIID